MLAMATTVAAVGLAVLGLHRPALAGSLLIAVAAVVVVRLVLETNALVEGPGPLGVLGTSGGVMVLPMTISGALLLIASGLERHEHRVLPSAPARPAAA